MQGKPFKFCDSKVLEHPFLHFLLVKAVTSPAQIKGRGPNLHLFKGGLEEGEMSGGVLCYLCKLATILAVLVKY